MHCCHIAARCLLTYTSVAFYTLHHGSISRGVTRGQGGAITRAPNHSGGAKKSQQCHTYLLQYRTFVSGRPQVRKWGRQTYFLPRAPSNLVTPLSIWRLVASRNSSTHLPVAKLRCRQTTDSRTALAIALKPVFRFHFRDL